ncbi:hypothetical protein LINPERHAP2_LOCUS19538 [Linum perenne]
MESDTTILILIPNMILGDHISSISNQPPQSMITIVHKKLTCIRSTPYQN